MERVADANLDQAPSRFICSNDPEEVVEKIGVYVELGFRSCSCTRPAPTSRASSSSSAPTSCRCMRDRFRRMSLEGRVMFMSGGSRGIGLAIAIRAARDGAKVALMAKTAEPHPKLPGTVFTRGGGDRGGRRRGAADRGRHPRRRGRRGGRGPDRGALRRDRPGRQQRQRDQPRPHARAAGQALRPDAADQPARDVRRHAGMPALPARVRPRARAHAVAAALDRPRAGSPATAPTRSRRWA